MLPPTRPGRRRRRPAASCRATASGIPSRSWRCAVLPMLSGCATWLPAVHCEGDRGPLTWSFPTSGLPCSWTAASGMAARSTSSRRVLMPGTGAARWRGMERATFGWAPTSGRRAGPSSGSGNTSHRWRRRSASPTWWQRSGRARRSPVPRADELLSLQEAARRSGVSASRLRRLAAAGILGARKVGSYWVVAEGDLEAFTRVERPRGVSVAARVRRAGGVGGSASGAT